MTDTNHSGEPKRAPATTTMAKHPPAKRMMASHHHDDLRNTDEVDDIKQTQTQKQKLPKESGDDRQDPANGPKHNNNPATTFSGAFKMTPQERGRCHWCHCHPTNVVKAFTRKARMRGGKKKK